MDLQWVEMDAHASSHSLSRKRRRDDSNGETEEGGTAAKFKRHTVVIALRCGALAPLPPLQT